MTRHQSSKRASRVSALFAGALLAVAAFALGGPAAHAQGAPGPFLRGDTNGTGLVDIADAVATLSYLFSSGPAPSCLDAADANDDGAVNLADAVGTLAYLFGGGASPLPSPFPAAGYDWTTDLLACAPVPCLPATLFGQEFSPGTIVVPISTPPQTWSPSILGVGLADVTFNVANSVTATFGAMSYAPGTGIGSLADSSFPVTASLVIDGPLFFDYSCTATITVGVDGTVQFDQSNVSPELIVVEGIASESIDLTVQGISLSSCGLASVVFDAVYPLISAYVNNLVTGGMEFAVETFFGNFLVALVNDQWDATVGGVAVCAP